MRRSVWPADTCGMKITLKAWAAARYDPPPSLWTLRRWAREHELHPAPELVGKTYYIDENARRLSAPPDVRPSAAPKPTLVERLKAADRGR